MTPWRATTEGGHNWRFIVIITYLIFSTILTSYGIKKATDASNQNTALIEQIRQTGLVADHKLCLSVKHGKEDRIKEYQFTLARTLRFYQDNPAIPKTQLRITVAFYHSLIQRTRDGIVDCPPISEGEQDGTT